MTSTAKLQLAITVDPEIPIPPKHYGGIERVVDMLVHGLTQRGHSITLFAHADSKVPCELRPYPGVKSQAKWDMVRNSEWVCRHVLGQKTDLVHSFGRLAYLLPVLPMSIPKVMSYQRHVTARSVRWGLKLARGTLHFTGCSRHIARGQEGNGYWHVIYNAAPLAAYCFCDQVAGDAPLMFLGRIEEIKGPHLAIETARLSERSLILAGNVPPGDQHRVFFEEKIAPFIDGQTIRYVGPVDDRQKNEYLRQAAALLMPILWDEPFGIVMAEALACGTPVIGLNRGSVPEVVESGVNGFACDSLAEMVEAVSRIQEIDRSACRRIMEEKFSDRAMVDGYEQLYRKLVGRKAQS